MSKERWPLPASWRWCKVSEIAQIVGGGTPPTNDESNFDHAGVPWITPADLTGYENTYVARGKRSLSEKGLASSSARVLPSRAVLYSSRAPIGYCAIAANPISTNQGFKSLVLHGELIPEFVRYYLIASKEYAESLASGTTFKELSATRMAEMLIPVAPANEQRRIVTKLDTLFQRLRNARKDLACIPRLVQRHKQAILSAAFAGELTKDDAGQWPVAALNEVIAGIDAGKNIRCEERPPKPEERGIVKVSSVTWGEFDPCASKTAHSSTFLDDRTLIHPGDFLISRANTVELVGACVIVGSFRTRNLFLSDKILRIRFNQPVERWVLYFLRSQAGRQQIEELATGNQLSMRNISQAAIRAIRLPLPPPQTRACILRSVEKMLTSIGCSLTESNRATVLLDRLEQAVLSKAFRGELAKPH